MLASQRALSSLCRAGRPRLVSSSGRLVDGRAATCARGGRPTSRIAAPHSSNNHRAWAVPRSRWSAAAGDRGVASSATTPRLDGDRDRVARPRLGARRTDVRAFAEKASSSRSSVDDADYDGEELAHVDELGEPIVSDDDDDVDANDLINTSGTDWGELALRSMRTTLSDDEFNGELEIYSFKVSVERRRVYASVDAVKDKFGSPTLDQLGEVSRKFNALLEEENFPEDVALEVASPGAERALRLPDDLPRFRNLTMKVTYAAAAEDDGAEGTRTRVMDVVDVDGDAVEFKLADVPENRPQAKKGQGMNKKQREWRLKIPIADVAKANLFIDV
ncbi:uncharacterized protein MICPUCDRAFT_60600 [Micromonas pusilla CCMP1545]|jgi:ribosome maturation factor RimP|uniref:Predicted protein n=1 Tax=Micromonas pusilla (strain CCMP1545) TaxID=564608 RepID=C1MZ47_MICPC|nr:uncharacterized protein MICPUCDRAFT_60600 [Micromonas pusilla CCMP1545]EEH54544.1 predicted protein [Micromonas pusilla CCMP1545]|eukprot:XP_003060894.1 predicted protein [Micromonas pusilla CCMP1545]